MLSFIYSLIIVKILLRPDRPNLEKAYDIEIKCKGIDEKWLNSNPSDSFSIPINKKHYLLGNIYYCSKPSNNYIFALHGWAYNRIGMLKYVDMLREMGFNVVLYDHRGLGQSGGRIVTLGNREKDDLHHVINYIKKNNHIESFGLFGVSMGASTCLLYQQKYHDARFIIADCGYASLRRLIKEVLKYRYHLPTFNLYIIEFFIFIIARFTCKQVSPLENINKVTCPVLFIHGLKDNLISHYHSLDMFNKVEGIKELLLIDDGAHAGAVLGDKKKYQETVQHFILRVMST